ncbi:DNA damage-regulated autophagy modulator protein 2 [Tetranychus urticae]|uniref:DNA damage-regulated autophagy modulator protein 2 n=1 Tax=Tetranychus urticae TaxID=32264 RepID=UPI00077B8E0D|nr:DNA damage-regulated autophagy modulator protein 2 [Tetranychus urticae]
MAWTNVHWVPLAASILLPATFITTYFLSVTDGNISPEFPYISDTGTTSPESCVFAQLLNIVAVLYLFTTYFRYKQVYHYYKDNRIHGQRLLLSINKISFLIGILACLGMSMVANFQETNLIRVHLTGALMCFCSGGIYCWLQTWITFKSYPHLNEKPICYIRFFLSTTLTITFIITFFLGPEAMRRFNGTNPRKWTRDEDGYYLHLIASLCEWVTAICIDCFIGTFVFDMKRLVMISPKVLFTTDNISITSIKITA